MGKYKGVHQRKSGTWYYRIKRVHFKDEEPQYYQESGFTTEEQANYARIAKLREIEYKANMGIVYEPIRFKDAFNEFLPTVESKTSQKKYQALYQAQLLYLSDRIIGEILDSEIDLLLFRLYLGGKKKSYIDSIRKLLNLIFEYCTLTGHAKENIVWSITTKPYKLRVLSLFSGIGAPEQALKNMKIPYSLVNYCEVDKKASEAYSLLHGVPETYNLWDINNINFDCCNEQLPSFDIMFFGFPCQDISSQGKQKGLVDESGELTRSGLFYKAIQIACWMLPKFMIAENVAALVSSKFDEDFRAMIQEISDAAYTTYWVKLNSKNFDIPQSRSRVFMIMVRKDMMLDFHFPEDKPLKIAAENWFENEVAAEYYATPKQKITLDTCPTHKPDYNRNCISCITTGWGTPSYTRQTFIKNEKGTRCLSSEELMKFQGFDPEQGTLLRNNKFSKNMVGKLVGNSITVNVLEAILKELFKSL